ncbi:MAG: helix-turn-helix transcriptional regulator [Myxococcales bacterium]|nr:helix-turn-helix transcriptional regulator [Myxococcales bacterium]
MAEEQVASNLGDNVRQLREARGLTQAQIAKVAGIPRPTWANLESGLANPTLAVLVKVANALQIRLEELISPPRAGAKLYPAASLPVRKRGQVEVRKLLPETIAGLEIERMVLQPRASMTGIPHTVGTREYLTCERGTVELSVAGNTWTLAPGDVVVFRGDQRHGYFNPGGSVSVAYSVISFAPVAL